MEDKISQILLRLAGWFNPPNGVDIRLTPIEPNGSIHHVEQMFQRAPGDLQYCVAEIRRLQAQQNQVRHALYDHAGEHRVGERECRDALEIRALRAQRDLLMVAVRRECAKFTFPDEDRAGLHDALREAEKIRWQDREAETTPIPISDIEDADVEALGLPILEIETAIAQADSEHAPALGSIAYTRGDQ